MVQLYFLSILLNGLSGYVLGFSGNEPDTGMGNSLRFSLNNSTFRLILGILTAVTGLLKLLSPIEGDVPVAGDLVPAILGLAAGFTLFFGYYREQSTIESEQLNRLDETIGRYKKWLSFVLLISAALHFLFPRALLL